MQSRACVKGLLAASVAAFIGAATLGDSVTAIGQFTGVISEGWEGFGNYLQGPDSVNYLASTESIFGGAATISNDLMAVYEPGTAAEFHLIASGFAQAALGTSKGMGLDALNETAEINFLQGVTAFGAYWGAASSTTSSPATVSVSFYGALGVLIDTVTFDYLKTPTSGGNGGGELDWHGWSFSEAVFKIIYSGDFVVIDELQANLFTTVIPLPAPVWIGLAGLIGVVAVRRRSS